MGTHYLKVVDLWRIGLPYTDQGVLLQLLVQIR